MAAVGIAEVGVFTDAATADRCIEMAVTVVRAAGSNGVLIGGKAIGFATVGVLDSCSSFDILPGINWLVVLTIRDCKQMLIPSWGRRELEIDIQTTCQDACLYKLEQ